VSRTHKTVRVTIERSEVRILRQHRRSRRWCSECGVESELIHSEEIKWLTLSPVPQSSPSCLSGVHTAKASDGSVLICVRSLNGVWASSEVDNRSRGDKQ